MRTFYVLALTAALAVPAFAQPPGGGRGRGGMGGGGGPTAILGSEDVQKDIKFTDEQKEKLKEFTAKQREAMQALGQDATQEQRQEARKKATEDAQKFVKDTLTEEQSKRLKEISLQNTLKNNPGALGTNEEYVSALKITDDQKGKIKDIADQFNKDRAELRQSGGGGGGGGGGRGRGQLSPEQQKKMDALSKEASDKVMEVLTADQKKTLQEMEGKPFEGKINMFGGGGRRGGGGGGR